MEVFKVFATLGLDSAEFQRGLDGAEQKLRGVQQSFGQAGRAMTTRVTLPLAAIGAGALKMGGDFEAAMNQVRAVSGASGDEFDALKQQARDLGATTQFSASEAAEAMNFMAMAGMSATDILGAMPDALQLAAAAQLDMGSTADIVTNILAGYRLESDELTRATDVLVQAFTSANTDLPQLAEAMKYAGPVASAAGVGFEEAAAAIGLMGNAGIQGSMAGTSLRGAISRMLSPTAKVSNLMREAGLSFTDAEGRLRPLDEIIQDLEPHADNAGLFMELFGRSAGPAMAALVGQGSQALTELTNQLEDSGGRAKEVADVQMEGLNGSLRLLKSATESLLISIAESGLLDAAAEFLTLLAGWFQKLSEVNPVILRMATVIGGVLAVIGPLLWFVGSFAGAIANLAPLLRLVPGLFTAVRVALTALTGPVGIVIAIITALAAAFATDFLGIRTKTVEAAKAIWGAMKSLGGWIADTVGSIIETFSRWGKNIKDAFGKITDGLLSKGKTLKDGFVNHFRGLADLTKSIFTGDFKGAFDAAKGILDNFWNTINDLFGGLPAKMLEWGKGMISGLIDGAKSLISDAVDIAVRIKDGIIQHFKSLVNLVRALFTGDFSGAFEAAKNIIMNFLGVVNDVFGGLPAKMLQFGKDMIMGLVDGLKSMVTNAVDAVKGVGSSIVNGFKGLLGIESPSKVFHGFGQDISRGLADGIDEGAPLAVNAMTRLANQVSSIGGAIVSGAWDDANVVAGVVGALEGKDAMKAIKERLETLSKTRLGLASQVSSPGVKDYQRSFIDAEVKALTIELKNLRADLRVSAKANARSGEVQTERFARSVATFDTGVRGLALSNQRY